MTSSSADLALGRARRARACGFRCARPPVAAEKRHQRGARVGRDRQARLPHLVVDQPRDLALAIGIAGDRDGVLRALAQAAQRRAAAKIAGLDHHAAIGRGCGDQRLHRRRDVAAAGLDPDRAACRRTAEWCWLPRPAGTDCRTGRRLRCAPAKTDRRDCRPKRDDFLRALAHQAGIGAVDQHHRPRRIRAGDKGIDSAALRAVIVILSSGRSKREPAQPVRLGFGPAREDARMSKSLRPGDEIRGESRLICSAMTLAARFSASRRPRSRAKRCCWPGMS